MGKHQCIVIFVSYFLSCITSSRATTSQSYIYMIKDQRRVVIHRVLSKGEMLGGEIQFKYAYD